MDNNLGSLSFSLNLNIDPSEKERLQKQLDSLNSVMNVSLQADPVTLRKSIQESLSGQKFDIKLGIDATSLKAELDKVANTTKSTSGGTNMDTQLGQVEALNLKLKQLGAEYKTLGAESPRLPDLLSEFGATQAQLTSVGKNITVAFQRDFDQVMAMAETTSVEIKEKMKAISLFGINIPTIGAQESIDQLQLKLAALKGQMVEMKTMSIGGVMGMSQNSLSEIEAKLTAIRQVRNGINFNDPAQMSNLTSLNQAEGELLGIQKQRLNQGVKLVETAKQQYSWMGRLLERIAVYAGISAIGMFTQKLVQVSGEFQIQQRTLEAIIADKPKADAIFNEVIAMGLQSPFKIMDLNNTVKQLSAYRVEADKLVDTTKMLSDISAGLGTDVGRLTLAYGEVKSATYMSGKQLRMFAQDGIPMIEALAKKVSEATGRTVSLGEAYDMISKKQISFKMVDEVLHDLTAQGGVFFDMQKKQVNTISGAWSNLADAIDLMYKGIGEDNDSFIMKTINGLQDMTKHWRDVWAVIAGIITAFGTYKLAVLALSVAQKSLAAESVLQAGISREEAMAAELNIVRQAGAMGKLGYVIKGLSVGFMELKASILSTLAAAWPMLLISALIGIGTWLYNDSQAAKSFQESLTGIRNTGLDNAKNLVQGLTDIEEKLKKAKIGSQEYRDAITTLQDKYGAYLNKLQLEGQSYAYIAKQIEKAKDAVYQKAKADADASGLTAINNKYANQKDSTYTSLKKELIANGVTEQKAIAWINEFTRQIQDNAKRGVNLTEGLNARSNIAQIEGITINKQTGGINKNQYYTNSSQDYAKTIASIYKDIKNNSEENGIVFQTAAHEGSNSSIDLYNTLTDVIKKAEAKANEEIKQEGEKKGTTKQEVDDRKNEILKNLYTWEEEFVTKYNAKSLLPAIHEKLVGVNPSVDYTARQNAIHQVLSGYSENIINQFMPTEEEGGSMDKIIPKIQNAYKKSTEDKAASLVELPKLNEHDKASTQANIDLDNSTISAAKALASFYHVTLDGKSSGGSRIDPEIKKLEKIVDLVEKANKEYKKLLETDSPEDARKLVNRDYGKELSGHGLSVDTAIDPTSFYQKTAARSLKMSGGNTLYDKIQGITTMDKAIETEKQEVDKWKTLTDLYDEKKKLYDDLKKLVDNGYTVADATAFIEQQVGHPINLSAGSFEKDFANQTTKLGSATMATDSGKAFSQKFSSESSSKLTDLLTQFQTISDKIVSVNAKYDDIIAQYDAQIEKTKSTTLIKELEHRKEVANQYRQDEISALTSTILQSTEMYKELFGNINDLANSSVKSLISQWNTALDNAKKSPLKNGMFTIDINGEKIQVNERDLDNLEKKVLEVTNNFDKNNPFQALINDLRILDTLLARKRELNINTQGAENSIKASQDQLSGASSGSIQVGGVTVAGAQTSLLPQTIKDSTNSLPKLKKNIDDTNKAIDDSTKSVGNDIIANAEKYGNYVKEAFSTLTNAISVFGSTASQSSQQTIKGVEEIIGGVQSAAKGIGELASGNIIQGTIDTVSGVITTIGGIIDVADARHQRAIEAIQKAIDNSKIAYQQLGQAAKYAIGEAINQDKALEIQQLQLQETLLKQQEAQENAKKKPDQKVIKQYDDSILQIQNQIQDSEHTLLNDIIGTDIQSFASTLGNALVSAFDQGTGSALAFGNTVKEMLRGMIVNALSQQILQTALKPMFDYINGLYATNPNYIITAQDIAMIEQMGNTVYDNIEPQLAALTGSLQATQTSTQLQGLTAGISGASENEIAIIAAYLNTIRDVVLGSQKIDNQKIILMQTSLGYQSQTLIEVQSMNSRVLSLLTSIQSVITNAGSSNGSGIRVFVK